MKNSSKFSCLMVLIVVVWAGNGDIIADEPFLDSKFSKVEKGELPQGWESPTETMMCSGGNLKIFRPADGEHSVTADVANWPDNYRATFRLQTIRLGELSFGSQSYSARLGEVTVILTVKPDGITPGGGSNAWLSLNDSEQKLDKKIKCDGAAVSIVLEKKQNAFTPFVNGVEGNAIRIKDARPPKGFTFSVRLEGDAVKSRHSQFALKSLQVAEIKVDKEYGK